MKTCAGVVTVAFGCALAVAAVPAAFAQSGGPPNQSQMTHQLTPTTPVPPALNGQEQGIPVPGVTAAPAGPKKEYVPTSTGGSAAPPPAQTATPERQPSVAPSVAARPGCTSAADTGNPALSLKWVTFQFGSAVLWPEAIAVLQTLGKTLKENFPDSIFVIEGHTDAVGAFDYNHDLSVQRAQAVKDYLTKEMGINPDHLQVTGLGYCDLANPRNPRGAENRRVVVINKTS
jgi:outer membrane protein OmpA-like peptidoglycan-associated protein